jgi:hypothetical protein
MIKMTLQYIMDFFSGRYHIPRQKRNVKTSTKSTHHEDFDNVVTFGWFGHAFIVMSAQNSAIFG